jgi:hypothetical protein
MGHMPRLCSVFDSRYVEKPGEIEMTPNLHSATGRHPDPQALLPYVEAAHAANEFVDDWDDDTDTMRPAQGILTSVSLVFSAAAIAWLAARWFGG